MMGSVVFITQNAWLSTDYGKRFQEFSIGKLAFQRIIDTSSRFFANDSQSINAVIAFFDRGAANGIVYETLDSTMEVRSQRTIVADQKLKWGHAASMPLDFAGILEHISLREESVEPVQFGQGINFRRDLLGIPTADIPIIDKLTSFVADEPDGSVPPGLISTRRSRRIPALIMPRGIGARHFCMFNACRAFSHSYVELYLPSTLWESDVHYCLWAYLNSSLVWLFREVTGRKNLGGGMLKAEATDIKSLPISFRFDFGLAARSLFEELRQREPEPVSTEIYSREHLVLDDLISDFFDIGDAMEGIRKSLVEQVEFRRLRARR